MSKRRTIITALAGLLGASILAGCSDHGPDPVQQLGALPGVRVRPDPRRPRIDARLDAE